MREIKFRGKRIDTGEWVCGCLVCVKTGEIEIVWQEDFCTLYQLLKAKVIPESVGQFTGLKDKNGKEICEGDILDFGYPTTSRYDPDDDTFRLPIKVVVDFHGGAFWFKGEGYTDCNWHFYNSEDRLVIGNIYENPDLISSEYQ